MLESGWLVPGGQEKEASERGSDVLGASLGVFGSR